MDVLLKVVHLEKLKQYLKYGLKNLPDYLSRTFSRQTMDSQIKPLDLKLDLFALNSTILIQNNCEVNLSGFNRFLTFNLMLVMDKGFIWYTAVQIILLSWLMLRCLYMHYISLLKRIEIEYFSNFTILLLDLLYYSRRNIFDLEMPMETLLEKTQVSKDTIVDDFCMIKEMALSQTHINEFSNSESVVTRSAEKIYPGYCDMKLKKERTFMYSLRKKWTYKYVVTIYCTKCIQLWILCLIIIRHAYVLQVTAILSRLHFHQLFSFLSYRGDFRYGLYIRIGFFTICIKFYYWTCPNIFLLLAGIDLFLNK